MFWCSVYRIIIIIIISIISIIIIIISISIIIIIIRLSCGDLPDPLHTDLLHGKMEGQRWALQEVHYHNTRIMLDTSLFPRYPGFNSHFPHNRQVWWLSPVTLLLGWGTRILGWSW